MKVKTRKSYRCSCHWLSGRLRAGSARRNLQKCFIGAPQVLPGIVSHFPYEQRICMHLLFISWFWWWTSSCKELLAWCKRAPGFDVGNKANITRSIIAYTGTVLSLGSTPNVEPCIDHRERDVFDTGRNWSMIVGTSIGALNAGALAQFSPEAQCSQVQT